MSQKALSALARAFENDTKELEDIFQKADPQRTGKLKSYRFGNVLRSIGVSFTSFDIDRLVTIYDNDGIVEYGKFLADFQIYVDDLQASAHKHKEANGVAVALGFSDAVPGKSKGICQKTHLGFSEDDEPIPFIEAIAEFRSTMKDLSASNVFYRIDSTHQGYLSYRDFIAGSRDLIKIPEETIPTISLHEIFVRYVGTVHQTMTLEQFLVLADGVTEENASIFRDKLYNILYRRHTSLFDNYTLMADPQLEFVCPASVRETLSRLVPDSPQELIDDFVKRLLGGNEEKRSMEVIPFARFVDVLRDAIIRQESASDTTMTTSATPKVRSESASDRPRSPAERGYAYEDEEEHGEFITFNPDMTDDAFTLRRLMLEAAHGSVLRINQAFVVGGRPIGSEGDIGLPPGDVVRMFTVGLNLRLSVQQKDYVASHCIDDATGLVSMRQFFDHFRLHTAAAVPRSVGHRKTALKTAFVESPAPKRVTRPSLEIRNKSHLSLGMGAQDSEAEETKAAKRAASIPRPPPGEMELSIRGVPAVVAEPTPYKELEIDGTIVWNPDTRAAEDDKKRNPTGGYSSLDGILDDSLLLAREEAQPSRFSHKK